MKKKQTILGIIGIIFTLVFVITVIPVVAQNDTKTSDIIEYRIDFSEPVISREMDGSTVIIPEATGIITDEGCPRLPVFSHTFEFPLGTQIISIVVQPSEIRTMQVDSEIRPVPARQKISSQTVLAGVIREETVYSSADPYPATWYTISTGAGLNDRNDHTLFVTIHITPARYIPSAGLIEYCKKVSVQIISDGKSAVPAGVDRVSLVIIAPEAYAEQLQPLLDHKNTHGLSTILVTLEDIYSTYFGRDQPEQIKYFIKHALEEYESRYILLVGDMKKLPIRVTYASWWERDLLSDLYYADVYDASGQFCSWDNNHNGRFGEIDDDGNDLDGVDLYADVHIGRLACADQTELITVVNKIITYEEETYNQIWFHRLVCAGGDTFPVSNGAPPFIYEGEITNIKVGQVRPDFDKTYLWTSRFNLHPASFNRAINKGAGFVSYAGHGFEHGWGTSRPNAITKVKITYYTPHINGLRNGNKLPIIFFDACLTAKLDFNITDLQHYYPGIAHLLARVFGLSSDPSDSYQCFAWSFLAKQNGGAIATIGSTRTAYTWVDANGVYGGAGYLDVQFFKAYTEGIMVGEMMTKAQNSYIQNVGPDYFTIEEFMLLGDPSLMVGGYP